VVAVRRAAGERSADMATGESRDFLNYGDPKKGFRILLLFKDTQQTVTTIPYFLDIYAKNRNGLICPRIKIFLSVKIKG